MKESNVRIYGMDYKYPEVLVLSNERYSGLIEALIKLNFLPIIRREMNRALEILRHERLDAIVVDDASFEEDVMEFILNVRDIDDQVIVIVIDRLSAEYKKSAILEQGKTFLLESNSDKIEEQIEYILG